MQLHLPSHLTLISLFLIRSISSGRITAFRKNPPIEIHIDLDKLEESMNIRKSLYKVKARQIITSRGQPTVEVDLHTEFGDFRASCPSGASVGSKEACAIVDKKADHFFGLSVEKAIANVKNIIAPKLKEAELVWEDQDAIDKLLNHLDGTKNKKLLGANAMLPVSMAACRAGAECLSTSLCKHISSLAGTECKLPKPCFNVLNGGCHAGNNLAIQEIMVSFNHDTFAKNYESGVVFFHHLKKVIEADFGKYATSVGDEGGFVPPIDSLEQGLNLIMKAYEISKLDKMSIMLDCAASEFYKDGKYDLGFKCNKSNKLKPDELIAYYHNITNKYPLITSIEDPFAEEDYASWAKFTQKAKINVVGDDLTVTNIEYIQKSIDEKLCNTLLVKLNQIGTVTESIEAVTLARQGEMKIFVSHRSGETEDTFIADFAVGIGADYIKSGAPCRGERTAKYNQLLRIEQEMESEKRKHEKAKAHE